MFNIDIYLIFNTTQAQIIKKTHVPQITIPFHLHVSETNRIFESEF